MRKFFSLMAAILFAGSMMADSFAPKALADITADDVVIVTMQKGDNVYAMSNDNGTSNPPTAVAVTVADGKISTTATNILWTMAKDGDNLSFAAGENHLYCTNTNNGVRVGANTGTFIISDGYLCCTSTSSNRFLGVYNSQDWRCYTTINSNISGQTLAFYVREGEGGGDDPQPQPLANGYYLVGNQYNWTPAAERMFAVNPDNEAEMVLAGVELAADDSLKVVYVENDAIVTWFPNNAGNYVVDAAHAGEKDIYFRADYAGDQNYWYAGCIYIAENVVPVADFTQPFTLKFNGTGNSGSDASAAFAADVAVIFDAASVPYVTEVTEATKVYAGRPIADDNSNVKFGTSSAQGTLAFTLAQAIEVDSIVVNATQYGNNASKITVNGTEFDLNAGNKVPQNVKITPAGEISAITIAQSSSERMYLRYVAVYPKQGGVDPQPQPLADGFYLVGTMNDWMPAAEYKFAVNPDNEAEMVLAGVTLAENAELKVRQVENGVATAWFPDGENNNYVVDAAHAGLKDVYFRADYAGAADWYAGCIYIAANTGSAIINTEAAKVAVKQLRNGMVIIRRGDREYSIMGQLVK